MSNYLNTYTGVHCCVFNKNQKGTRRAQTSTKALIHWLPLTMTCRPKVADGGGLKVQQPIFWYPSRVNTVSSVSTVDIVITVSVASTAGHRCFSSRVQSILTLNVLHYPFNDSEKYFLDPCPDLDLLQNGLGSSLTYASPFH